MHERQLPFNHLSILLRATIAQERACLSKGTVRAPTGVMHNDVYMPSCTSTDVCTCVCARVGGAMERLWWHSYSQRTTSEVWR
eukprot:795385-Pelagomonas_calceolata.AAC.1